MVYEWDDTLLEWQRIYRYIHDLQGHVADHGSFGSAWTSTNMRTESSWDLHARQQWGQRVCL